MASRTIVLGGVAVVAAAAAAYWFLYMQDEAPPPAKPVAMAPKADAPKPTAVVTSEAAKPAGQPVARDAASLDAAIKSTQSRVGELERTVSDLQSQIAMKDKAIAELEKKLGTKR